MPRLTVYSIRISFIYLAAGFTIGMLMLINKVIPMHAHFYALLPAHIEIMVFGWLINFIFGVAFWMFPRFYKAPARGNQAQNKTGFYVFNAGILIVLTENIFLNNPAWVVAGRIVEAAGVIIVFSGLWRRVFRPSMTHD